MMACFINLTSHKFISFHTYLLVSLQLLKLKVKILGILILVFQSSISYSYSKEAILHLSSSWLVVWNRTWQECLRAWVLSYFSDVGLCDPVDCSLPGSSVHGILQARILEWIVVPSSWGSSRPKDQTHFLFCLMHWQMCSFHQCHLGSLRNVYELANFRSSLTILAKSCFLNMSLAFHGMVFFLIGLYSWFTGFKKKIQTSTHAVEKRGNSDRFSFLGLQKHCGWWLQPWNKKMLSPWKKSCDKPRQCIIKQRHHFTKKKKVQKGLYSQNYGFSSSYVWMWELDNKEGWVLKNWGFWTVMLEKTLESSLDSKEIKPVNPKGNQL